MAWYFNKRDEKTFVSTKKKNISGTSRCRYTRWQWKFQKRVHSGSATRPLLLLPLALPRAFLHPSTAPLPCLSLSLSLCRPSVAPSLDAPAPSSSSPSSTVPLLVPLARSIPLVLSSYPCDPPGFSWRWTVGAKTSMLAFVTVPNSTLRQWISSDRYVSVRVYVYLCAVRACARSRGIHGRCDRILLT